MSFNVCANQLHVSIRNKLIKALTSLHEEFKAIGVDLVMEITEDERLEKVEKVIETLKIINRTGIKIAIDDYGRYFSSPSMVSFIEDLHILKVDKSFISSLEANCLISKSFIKHALDIAEIKKCQIIIEGIEKGSQIKLLGSTANHSTIWYQGYFFSQPKPICEL
nr:EAL domain-containing protein [Aeromonas jandaei]